MSDPSFQKVRISPCGSQTWLLACDGAEIHVESLTLGTSRLNLLPRTYAGGQSVMFETRFELPPCLWLKVQGREGFLGPVVAILAKEPDPSGKTFGAQDLFFRELTQTARERGVFCYVLTPREATKDYPLGYVQNEGGGWDRGPCPLPHFIYNRYFGSPSSVADAKKRLLARGAVMVNNPIPEKWGCYQFLKRDPQVAPHLPETRLLKSHDDILLLLSRYSSVYVKPRTGYRGAGIVRIGRRSPGGYKISHARGKTQQIRSLAELGAATFFSGRHIVQQGITLWGSPAFYDLKVLVQNRGQDNWTVTGKVARRASTGQVTTHLHLGGTALSFDDFLSRLPASFGNVSEQIDELALRIARLLASQGGGLEEISIDMGLDVNGKIWILEVNGKPSRKSFKAAKDFAARQSSYQYFMDYVISTFAEGLTSWMFNEYERIL